MKTMKTKEILTRIIREEVQLQLRKMQLSERAPAYKKGESLMNRYDDKVRVTHVFPDYDSAVEAYNSGKDRMLVSRGLDPAEYMEDDYPNFNPNEPVYFVKVPGGDLEPVPQEFLYELTPSNRFADR